MPQSLCSGAAGGGGWRACRKERTRQGTPAEAPGAVSVSGQGLGEQLLARAEVHWGGAAARGKGRPWLSGRLPAGTEEAFLRLHQPHAGAGVWLCRPRDKAEAGGGHVRGGLVRPKAGHSCGAPTPHAVMGARGALVGLGLGGGSGTLTWGWHDGRPCRLLPGGPSDGGGSTHAVQGSSQGLQLLQQATCSLGHVGLGPALRPCEHGGEPAFTLEGCGGHTHMDWRVGWQPAE